jgi:hypothetical protein
MDPWRAAAHVALSAIAIARGGVLHSQASQPAFDSRSPTVQSTSELQDGMAQPAVVVDLTAVLRMAGAPFDARSPEDTSGHRTAAWMFGTAATIDWATTAHSLAFHHGHEQNPLINWAPTPATTIAVGAAIDIAGAALWERLMRDHPTQARIGLYVAAGARLFVAGRNEYRIAHAGTCATPPRCQLNCVDVFNRCR